MMSVTKLLEIEVDLLRRRIVELEQVLAQVDTAANGLRLAERTKELSALYHESYLSDRLHAEFEDYFVELVALLPLAWQHTTDACARILVAGRSYTTPNFQESPWQQSDTIVAQGKAVGQVTVGYLSYHPDADVGPFLHEERSLLSEIARRIGHYLERSQTERSQRFLAAIVESSDNAIVSVTLDGLIQTWNASATRIYGYQSREVAGKSLAQILPPRQYDEILQRIHRLREGYGTEQFECTLVRRDGLELQILIGLSPILDFQDRIVGAVLTAHDVSTYRMIEATLRESDERLRSTFDQAAVGLAHLSLEGRYMRVNQRLCAILGFTPSELLSMSTRQLTHPDDLAAEEALMQAMLAGECSTYSLEKRSLRKDGSLVWVNRTVSLVRDLAGHPKYFVGVIEDISQRKQAEQARLESELRYHDLFENSPISLWEQDFSGVKAALTRLHQQGISDLRAFFEQNPAAVAACLAQVKLLAFNRASLTLYGADSRDTLRSSLDRLLPPEGYPFFIDELVWIDEGQTAFSWQGVNCRLSGERMRVRLNWSVVPGHEQTLDRVLVSIEEVAGNHNAPLSALR